MRKLINWIKSKKVKLILLSEYNSLKSQLSLKDEIIKQKITENIKEKEQSSIYLNMFKFANNKYNELYAKYSRAGQPRDKGKFIKRN